MEAVVEGREREEEEEEEEEEKEEGQHGEERTSRSMPAILGIGLVVLCVCGWHARRAETREGPAAQRDARGHEGNERGEARGVDANALARASSESGRVAVPSKFGKSTLTRNADFTTMKKRVERRSGEFPVIFCENRSRPCTHRKGLIAVNDMHAALVEDAKGSGVEVRYNIPVGGVEDPSEYEEMTCHEQSEPGSCLARIIHAYDLYGKMLRRLEADDAKVVQNALVSMGLEQDHLADVLDILKEFRAELLAQRRRGRGLLERVCDAGLLWE